MNRQPTDSTDRDAAPPASRPHAPADSGNPNDALEAAERELREGPAPLGEDGGDPGHSRSSER